MQSRVLLFALLSAILFACRPAAEPPAAAPAPEPAAEETREEEADIPAEEPAAAEPASGEMGMINPCEGLIDDAGRAHGLVHFPFDQAALSSDDQARLTALANCLRESPSMELVVEGHCDERGTQEYNLALGQRRAATVVRYLSLHGIAAERLRPVSKGKNELLCNQAGEACHQENRRANFVIGGKMRASAMGFIGE